MIFFYRLLQFVLLPLVLVTFAIRWGQSKEHPQRWREKWGLARQNRPAGNLVHLHAASVGEANSLLPLIAQLAPHMHVLLTTGTVTSAKIMAQKLPEIVAKTKTKYKIIHQFSPLDFYPLVRRFYRHWQPGVTVFAESEFWPELITQAPKSMLINARISERSWPKYQRWQWFFKALVQRFSAVFAQQQQDAERLEKLGAQNVIVAGNLKFDADPLSVDEQALQAFQAMVKERKVILFASTHPGEEAQALALYNQIKANINNALLVIVPRHPNRGAEIKALLRENAMVMQRSQNEKITDKTDVYLADTLGELGLFYRVADVAIMGGSLVAHGGQNPLEGILLGALTFSGPHMFNFADMLPLITDVFQPAKSLDALTAQVLNSLQEKQQEQRTQQSQIMASLTGPTDKIAVHILEQINNATT